MSVAGALAGPFRAERSGRAIIPVAVPPGVEQVVIHSEDQAGNATEATTNKPETTTKHHIPKTNDPAPSAGAKLAG